MYLLKSLSENHFIDESEQTLPCCGFTIYARDKQLNCVDIIGCCNGIDWSVIHTDGHVKLITSTGKEALIPFSNINFSFDFITKRFPGSQSINRHRYQPLFYPERCMALP